MIEKRESTAKHRPRKHKIWEQKVIELEQSRTYDRARALKLQSQLRAKASGGRFYRGLLQRVKGVITRGERYERDRVKHLAPWESHVSVYGLEPQVALQIIDRYEAYENIKGGISEFAANRREREIRRLAQNYDGNLNAILNDARRTVGITRRVGKRRVGKIASNGLSAGRPIEGGHEVLGGHPGLGRNRKH